MIARVAVALLAVVVVAWLAVLYRDQRLADQGVKAASPAQADRDLRRARLLNPDTGPDIWRSFRLAGAGDRTEAVAVLDGVLRREPDNLYAWTALLTLSRGRDPANTRRAVAALRRIDALDALSATRTR